MKEFVVDSSVLIQMLKPDQTVFKRISLDSGIDEKSLLFSAVSVGELEAFALKNRWGGKKLKSLAELLQSAFVVPVTVDDAALMDAYAQIDAYNNRKHPTLALAGSARTLGQNDVWIAATAMSLGATLLTLDRDFAHLPKGLVEVRVYAADGVRV